MAQSHFHHPLLLLAVGLVPALGCADTLKAGDVSADTAETEDLDPSDDDAPGDPGDTEEEEGGTDTGTSTEDTGTPPHRVEDDALVHTSELPTAISCGETASATISVRNTGAATWTRSDGYKLGTVDDSDPFYTGDTRVWLSDEAVVTTGEIWTFEFELQAPEEAGSYTSDWRMVHEGVQWFGESLSQVIEVTCDTPDTPDTPTGPPDLDEVIWLHTDVSDWAVTSVLSSVTESGTSICLEYDKADEWPIHEVGGTEVVANPWIFIWQDDVWYAGTWEWMRPGQTCKSMSSVAGSHIKVAPFPEHGGWEPTSGQTYWFMVSGLARWSERSVAERTNLVSFVWP